MQDDARGTEHGLFQHSIFLLLLLLLLLLGSALLSSAAGGSPLASLLAQKKQPSLLSVAHPLGWRKRSAPMDREHVAPSLRPQPASVPSDLALFIAMSMGAVSSLCATLQYLPQLHLNYTRRSTAGFSGKSIAIKMVGSAFHFANTFLLREAWPTVLYGFSNVLTHCLFMYQFATYGQSPVHAYLYFCLVPFVPLFLGVLAPGTLSFTNIIKPVAQIVSHVPQILLSIEKRSTQGVSLNSQWLNFISGITGLYMCSVIPPVSRTTYLIYLNSLLQAISLFLVAWYYDGPQRIFSELPHPWAVLRRSVPGSMSRTASGTLVSLVSGRMELGKHGNELMADGPGAAIPLDDEGSAGGDSGASAAPATAAATAVGGAGLLMGHRISSQSVDKDLERSLVSPARQASVVSARLAAAPFRP